MTVSISIHALVKRATGNAPVVQATPLISIHALVKRATRDKYRLDKKAKISIHALVKRATVLQKVYVVTAERFQSTPS